MEFRWETLSTLSRLYNSTGIGKVTTMVFERYLAGKQHVAFHPLKEHGTTYVHRDLAVDIKRGGFHMTKLNMLSAR